MLSWLRPWGAPHSLELRTLGDAVHPDDVAKLPPGTVLGDPSRQQYGMGGPRYVYLDVTRACRACGAAFVFSADEQKHWYETLGFFTDAEAVECPACRRRERARRESQRRHARAARAAGDDPGDPSAGLALARSTVALFETSGAAALDAGIAAARVAQRSERAAESLEGLYCEAPLQAAAGRDSRALLERFVRDASRPHRRGLGALLTDARRRLGLP